MVVLAIWLPRKLLRAALSTPDEPSWLNRSANFYYALTMGILLLLTRRNIRASRSCGRARRASCGATRNIRTARSASFRDEFHDYVEGRPKEVTPLELLRTAAPGRSWQHDRHGGQLSVCPAAGRTPGRPCWLAAGHAFDPFHLALTRLLPLDGLFSNLVLLSLLAYCSCLHGRQQTDPIRKRKENISRPDHIGSRRGLGWLTKSPALFLVPVVGLLR